MLDMGHISVYVRCLSSSCICQVFVKFLLMSGIGHFPFHVRHGPVLVRFYALGTYKVVLSFVNFPGDIYVCHRNIGT